MADTTDKEDSKCTTSAEDIPVPPRQEDAYDEEVTVTNIAYSASLAMSCKQPDKSSKDNPAINRVIIVIGVILLIALVGFLVWKSDRAAPAGPVAPQPQDALAKQTKPGAPGKKALPGRSSLPQRAKGGFYAANAEVLLKQAVLTPEQRGTHVYVIVIDTLRADYATPYGARNDTTPLMAQLAADGVKFNNVLASASWTAASMASMWTGLYPREHGITDGTITKSGQVIAQQVLPPEAVTLADVLKENGYTTFGINSNYHMNQRFGFAQGFDYYVGDNFAHSPMPNLGVAAFQPYVRRSNKAFVWIHYLDPHYPYHMEVPWAAEWNDTRFRNNEEMAVDILQRFYARKAGVEDGTPIPAQFVDLANKLSRALSFNHEALLAYLIQFLGTQPGDEYYRLLQTCYMSEVRLADDGAEKALAAMGVTDKDLVVMVSDHGEELGDHSRLGHRQSLYQELLKVPLVIRLPNKQHAGKVIEDWVSLVDLMPTLVDLLNLPVPKDISGRSLKPLIEGQNLLKQPLFAETKYYANEFRTVLDWPWKYIIEAKPPKEALFNLAIDASEKTNLKDKNIVRVAAMRKILETWMAEHKTRWETKKSGPLSPQEIQRLKAMGYMR